MVPASHEMICIADYFCQEAMFMSLYIWSKYDLSTASPLSEKKQTM